MWRGWWIFCVYNVEMRYASVPAVQSLDDLMGSGPSFVTSLPVADWEAIDRDLDGLWRDEKKKKEEEAVITDPDPIEEEERTSSN